MKEIRIDIDLKEKRNKIHRFKMVLFIFTHPVDVRNDQFRLIWNSLVYGVMMEFEAIIISCMLIILFCSID